MPVKNFDTITVYFDYRFDAGPNSVPSLKALRARVKETDAKTGRVVWGADLIAPRYVTSLVTAKAIVLDVMRIYTLKVRFEYSVLLDRPPELTIV